MQLLLKISNHAALLLPHHSQSEEQKTLVCEKWLPELSWIFRFGFIEVNIKFLRIRMQPKQNEGFVIISKFSKDLFSCLHQTRIL